MDRNYARELARKTGHYEALDFIDVAEDYQLEDVVSRFEAESRRKDREDYCKHGDKAEL